MEDVLKPFCSVCREAIIERIHSLVNPVLSHSPSNTVPLGATSALTFALDIIEPNPSYMTVKWYVNDVLVETINANGAAAGATDFSWAFDCANGALVTGSNTVKAVVRDNSPMVRSHLHPNPPFFDHNDHDREVEWTVNFNGEDPDLLIRDFYQQSNSSILITDEGIEPWTPFPLEGWFFDYTSDIKVSPTTQGSTPFDAIVHQNPLGSGITNYVNVRITNRGCTEFISDDVLHLYTSISGGSASWPGNWTGTFPTNPVGYEITHSGSVPVPATVPDIPGGASVVVEIPWYVQDIIPLEDVDWNSCLLARIEDVTVDPISTQTNLTDWIRQNNNIAMRNLTVDEPDGEGEHIVDIDDRLYSGGYTYLGNTGSVADTIDIYIQKGLQPDGSPDLFTEAEVVVFFHEVGWDVSGALANTSIKALEQKGPTLFRAPEDGSISGLIVPADTVVPVFVGYAFLTEEVGDSMNYVVHINQRKSAADDIVTWSQHYQVKRNSRTLFTANAGADQTILLGDTVTLSAASIGETSRHFWHAGGTQIGTGTTKAVNPSSTTIYTLESIAEADGFKDYDEVTVNVKLGLITSVAPNPATSTTTVAYRTTSVSTAQVVLVEVSTATEHPYTITPGNSSININLSGYNTGAYTVVLKGDGNVLDTKSLIVQ